MRVRLQEHSSDNEQELTMRVSSACTDKQRASNIASHDNNGRQNSIVQWLGVKGMVNEYGALCARKKECSACVMCKIATSVPA